MSDTPVDRLTDDQVQFLIARAAELDARGRKTTTDELRAIASEVGISSEAIEAALQEHAGTFGLRRSRLAGRVAAVIPAAGLPLGIAAGTLLGGIGPLTVLGALIFMAFGLSASGALLVLQVRHATIRQYQWRNLTLWGSVTAGYLTSTSLFELAPTFPGIILGWFIGWVASSIIGCAAVVAIRSGASEAPSDHASPPTVVAGSLRSRLATMVKRAAARILRFIEREGNRTTRILRGRIASAQTTASAQNGSA